MTEPRQAASQNGQTFRHLSPQEGRASNTGARTWQSLPLCCRPTSACSAQAPEVQVCLAQRPAWTEMSKQVSNQYQSSDQGRQGPASEDGGGTVLRWEKEAKQPYGSQQASGSRALIHSTKMLTVQSLHKMVLAAAAMQYEEPPNHISGKKLHTGQSRATQNPRVQLALQS